MFNKKRGQITVFIIIGIVILISVGIVVYVSTNIITEEEVVPEELKPLKLFIRRCTTDLADEAAFRMGAQGGYLNLPDKIKGDPNSYINGVFDVPYWYFDREDRMPSRTQMQKEIETYINQNIRTCLNNFESFKDEFEITEYANPSSEVIITDDKITTTVFYPIDIKNKKQDKITPMENTIATINSKLGETHKVAEMISNKENEEMFLENLTMDMVHAAFPTYGFNINCHKERHHIDLELIPQLKNMLLANFQYIMFDPTDYNNPDIAYYENRAKFTLTTATNLKNIKVDTIYNPSWLIKMDVSPSNKRVVEPLKVELPLAESCIKVYNHKYEIKFPVMFQVMDKESGFSFRFATPVIIKNNKANRQEPFSFPKLDTVLNAREYCEDTSTELTVTAEDDYTNQRIYNASIEFRCINFVCDLGKTDVEMYENYVLDPYNYLIKTQVPECGNAVITASKEGYLTATDTVTTGTTIVAGEEVKNNNLYANLRLIPLREVGYSFVIHEKSGTQLSSRELREDETVVLIMTNQDQSYEKIIYYPQEPRQSLELMVGKFDYDVDMTLFKGENIIGGYKGKLSTLGQESEVATLINFQVIGVDFIPSDENTYTQMSNIVEQESKNREPSII